MENLIQYIHSCELAMFSYLKTGDLESLVKALKKVENHAKRNIKDSKDKSLWFKFFKGDTGATDVRDLEIGLNPNRVSTVNHEYFINQLKKAVRLDGGLQVYFS